MLAEILNVAHVRQAIVDAVMAVKVSGKPLDLFMVEIMEMKHRSDCDST